MRGTDYLKNNIAIVKLSQPIRQAGLRLPSANDTTQSENFILTVWKPSITAVAPNFRNAEKLTFGLTVLSRTSCQEQLFRFKVQPSMICVTSDAISGVCQVSGYVKMTT
jgi:hypothetical protein